MADSVVDIGAGAVEGIGDFFSESYDFLFGTPEASASGGYYKSLGPGARQYFSGPGEYKRPSLLEAIGFSEGGNPAVETQDDGSLPGVDDLRYMTPEEVEEGSYAFLQDMEQKMMDHLSAAQSPVTTESGVPMQAAPDNRRYHYEEAERLRGLIDQFRERRASAVLNYPDSETKLYMKEGQAPYVRGFPDSLVQGFDNGGVVSLGAGESNYTDMGEMSMNDMFAVPAQPGDQYYVGEFPGRVYREGDQITDPYYLDPEYNFESEGPQRFDMYQDFAPSVTRLRPEDLESGQAPEMLDVRGFRSAEKLYLAEGGNPAVEIQEAGIMSALLDPRIDLPSSAEQEVVRQSGREGSEGSALYYAEGSPTFEQVLETKYQYPSDVDREIYNSSSTEVMRAERPRHDMPTYQELEDARAHALQTALLAQKLGPETAQKLGGIAEFSDRVLNSATLEDTKMDKRNNAFGATLLQKAGINATPQQITQMVDSAVFDQLDVILGREKRERRFKSPDTGIDIYFPRDKEGFFNVKR
jgi:hypothetical protein